jgi:uncharacterized protein
MVPFYFGDKEKQLFGVYYPPKIQVPQETGILICPPIAQEYIRTHLAIRQLSHLLSGDGSHVLKFDYYAVGDSTGSSEEGSVEQWKNDVWTAYNELRDISGAKRISIIGLRLGAAIAVEVLADGMSLKDIVLWDPVINGKHYLDELRQLQIVLNPNNKTIKKNGNEEILGFPFSEKMVRSIENVDLLTKPIPNAANIHLAVSEDKSQFRQLHETIKAKGINGCFQIINEPANWDSIKDYDQELLANKTIHSINNILSKPSE